MVLRPSCEVPSRTSRYTLINWEGRESELWGFQGTLVPLGVCCTHEVLWEHWPFRQYSHPPDGSPSWLICPKVFLGFGFSIECVIQMFCIPAGSAPLGLIFGYTISVTDVLHLDYN
jgi:hypothetical protein